MPYMVYINSFDPFNPLGRLLHLLRPLQTPISKAHFHDVLSRLRRLWWRSREEFETRDGEGAEAIHLGGSKNGSLVVSWNVIYPLCLWSDRPCLPRSGFQSPSKIWPSSTIRPSLEIAKMIAMGQTSKIDLLFWDDCENSCTVVFIDRPANQTKRPQRFVCALRHFTTDVANHWLVHAPLPNMATNHLAKSKWYNIAIPKKIETYESFCRFTVSHHLL